MTSTKLKPISYADYVELFEGLEEIRKKWLPFYQSMLSDYKAAYRAYENDLTGNKLMPYPNALTASEQGIQAYINKLSTPLTDADVFGEDYQNKVQKVNRSLLIMKDCETDTFYVGIHNSIELPEGEQNYKVLIQNQHCDCMGLGIDTTRPSVPVDVIWPDGYEVSSCVSNWKFSNYKWYYAKSLGYSAKLFGEALIDLLGQDFQEESLGDLDGTSRKVGAGTIATQIMHANFQEMIQKGLARRPKVNFDLMVPSFVADYTLPVSYALGVNSELDADYDLHANYDLNVDYFLNTPCTTANSCFEQPIMLLDKKTKKEVIRSGVQIAGPYLITISPKLKHWLWAAGILECLVHNNISRKHHTANCTGCTSKTTGYSVPVTSPCGNSALRMSEGIVDVGPPGTSYYTQICTYNYYIDSYGLLQSTASCVDVEPHYKAIYQYSKDCIYGTSREEFESDNAPRPLKKCARRLRKGSSSSCGSESYTYNITYSFNNGCTQPNADPPYAQCETHYVRRRAETVNITSPVIYLGESDYNEQTIGIALSRLSDGGIIHKLCVKSALALIKWYINYDKAIAVPSNTIVYDPDEQPYSLMMCDAIAMDAGAGLEGVDGKGMCHGFNLFVVDKTHAFNSCCLSPEGEYIREPNLIQPLKDCENYSTIQCDEKGDVKLMFCNS